MKTLGLPLLLVVLVSATLLPAGLGARARDPVLLAEAQARMLSRDLRPELWKISVPLLVIGTWKGREAIGFTRAKVEQQIGEQYASVPAHTAAISDTARHFVMLDDPAWLVGQIRRFLLIMTACMVAGVNVTLAPLGLPLANHAIVTAATIAGYLVGTRVRRRILGTENQRLRERLRAARESFADE